VSNSTLICFLIQSARKDTLFSDVAHIAESGDVLKAYDPYNSGVYKGIKVSKDSRETEVCRFHHFITM
jgi:hypothetical protein